MTSHETLPTETVEFAEIKLAEGKSEKELLAASHAFQRDFLDGQPGFVRRQLLRRSNGSFLDVIHWRSRAEADAVLKSAKGAPAVQAYFSVMVFDASDPSEGVEHLAPLAVYDAP